MTISNILATSAVVGLMSSAAFANGINFDQSNGSVGEVIFTQTGTGNIISANGTTVAEAASVVGSLDFLTLEQVGVNNKSSFVIVTAGSVSTVATLLKGDRNTSTLKVNQGAAGTFAFAVGFEGDNNSVTADISANDSLVKVDSVGNFVTYTINQRASADDNQVHKITADVAKIGDDVATVVMSQSGTANTIVMGAPSSYGLFTGTTGLTLNGAATVDITQSSLLASYEGAQTVTAGGTLTVSQTN